MTFNSKWTGCLYVLLVICFFGFTITGCPKAKVPASEPAAATPTPCGCESKIRTLEEADVVLSHKQEQLSRTQASLGLTQLKVARFLADHRPPCKHPNSRFKHYITWTWTPPYSSANVGVCLSCGDVVSLR